MHNDEAGVGRAVKESGISREKIWITSKLWPTEYGESKTLEAIDKILEHMQLDLFTSQPAILWVHGVIWEKYDRIACKTRSIADRMPLLRSTVGHTRQGKTLWYSHYLLVSVGWCDV